MTSTMAVASSSSSRTGSDCPALYMPRKPLATRPFPSSGFVTSSPILPRSSYGRSLSASPGSSISAKKTTTTPPRQSDGVVSVSDRKKRTCLCSRSTHPGSFRCSLHKNQPRGGGGGGGDRAASSHSTSGRLNLRRLAMANSLMRIGVEGDLVRRVLSPLVKPSVQEQRRRYAFRPRPSRLSAVFIAEDSR